MSYPSLQAVLVMNEQELFARIARLKARKLDDLSKCEALFALVASSLKQGGGQPVRPGFKQKLRRCVDEVYWEAMESQGKARR